MTNRLYGDKCERGSGHRNVPIRPTVKRVTPGAAMVTLNDVVTKITALSQNPGLTRWEKMCYLTAIAVIEKAMEELRR